MRKDSIAWLCCCCFHSLHYVFAILLFPPCYFPFFTVYLSRKCTVVSMGVLATPLSSWIHQSFTVFTSETSDPAFSTANSLSSVKATSLINISGKENGRVLHVPDCTVQMERKYGNYLHTHTVHRPYVYSWHEEGSVNAVSSSEHTAAAFRGISQVAEAFFRF